MSTMTQTEHPGRAAHSGRSARPAHRARLISGRLALVLMSSFGALTSFYLLLSVTPMYAMSAGAGSAEAGLVTGSLMLATVLAEFASARLMRRYGYRAVFAAGALLLGGPALALLGPRNLVTIVAVSIARGIGFGLNTVVIGALVATALPPERRGEGIGLAGVVACVPAIVALPSGVWLAENTGYAVVIAITAASALAPLAAVPWLAVPAGRQAGADPGAVQSAGLLASLRAGAQLRPFLAFTATTVSAGVVAAFLPLAVGVSGSTAAAGLFAQAVASTVSRWWAGRDGDRRGHARLLVPGLLTAAAGMIVLIWVAAPVALIAGMCLFGIGFGITQNVTFALMIDRAPASGYGTASALWNLAYDAGYGAGPAVFGVFVGCTGYPAAFALTGTLMLAALVPAIRDRTADGGLLRSVLLMGTGRRGAVAAAPALTSRESRMRRSCGAPRPGSASGSRPAVTRARDHRVRPTAFLERKFISAGETATGRGQSVGASAETSPRKRAEPCRGHQVTRLTRSAVTWRTARRSASPPHR